MKPEECYQNRESESSKNCVSASLCQFLLTNTIHQENFNKSMLHRPPSHLAEKTVLLPCKLRKPELSLQGQRKSLPSSGSDHLVLEMISMSRDVQVVVSWRLFALKVPCTSCFLGQYGRVSERRGGQLESCPCSSWLGATMACSGGQLASWFGAGKLRFLTDGQGKLGESDISHSTCHLSIQIFLAWFRTKLSATCVSSFAWLFCTHMLQQRFLVLNSATSNLLVTSFCPD